MKTEDVALSALVAAIYAVLVVALPMISFLMWQVRIADALLMLSTVLGWPAVLGVTMGCFVGNLLAAPWGSFALAVFDAIFGSVANFIASYLAYKLAFKKSFQRKAMAALVEIAVVSVIVGSYLRYLMIWAFNIDLPLWLSIASVLPGSSLAIGVAGTIVALSVERARVYAGFQR